MKNTKSLYSNSLAKQRFIRRLLTPSILIVMLIFLYPMLYSFVMSFNSVNISNQSWKFAGIANYLAIFKDTFFRKAISATARFTVISVCAEMVLGTAIAVLLNQDFKGRGIVRGIVIIPWALPTVVNAIMWKWIFNANYGAGNALLTSLHIIDDYQAWLANPKTAFICVLIANIWKETPYVVLLVLAGLQSIPSELYESARVDGYGAWKTFFKITLPLIKNILVILLITKTIWSIQTYDVIAIMTSGGPASATQLIAYYIQKTTFKFFDFGAGSAMSYVIMIATFLLSLLYIKSSREAEFGNK